MIDPVRFRQYCAAGILIFLTSWAVGQDIVGEVHNSPAPPPLEETLFQMPYLFVESDLNVNGNGYQAVSPDIGIGIDMEGRAISVTTTARYDFVRKTNDSDQVPNEKGRFREANAELLYKLHSGSSWFITAGAEWCEASMTPYLKSNWSPSAGAGHDFVNEVDSWRFQVSYSRDLNEVVRYPTLVSFTPGPGQAALSYTCSLCGNGVQAIALSGEYPSPNSSAHWFLLMTLETDWFHETITDPYNLAMTEDQKSQHYHSGSFSVGVIFRFKPLHFRSTF